MRGMHVFWKPTVSVVIPTYNRAHLVGRAIKSVLEQTYQDYQLLVIDDASTDATEQAVLDFRDPRVSYVRHPRNLGGSAARNTGIREAKGTYIALLDSDDTWLPKKLEEQVKKLRTLPDKVGVVYAGANHVVEETGEVKKATVPIHRGKVFDNLLERNFLASPTPLIRAQCFAEAGLFDEELPSCQDWDMWIRISRHYEFDFVQKILAEHYVHDERISADIGALMQGHIRLHEKIAADLQRRRKSHSLFHSGQGSLYCQKGSMAPGRRELLKALAICPCRAQLLLHLVASLAGPRAYRRFTAISRSIMSGGAGRSFRE
jgi:glycosyltransferase involved in cell wall biosynthesis